LVFGCAADARCSALRSPLSRAQLYSSCWRISAFGQLTIYIRKRLPDWWIVILLPFPSSEISCWAICLIRRCSSVH